MLKISEVSVLALDSLGLVELALDVGLGDLDIDGLNSGAASGGSAHLGIVWVVHEAVFHAGLLASEVSKSTISQVSKSNRESFKLSLLFHDGGHEEVLHVCVKCLYTLLEIFCSWREIVFSVLAFLSIVVWDTC